jgi:very-short-patch-repair endonuclease
MIRKKTYKQRKAKAIKTLKQYRNPDGTQKETGIERRMRVLLDSMGLYYIQEKAFSLNGKTRIFDFYVTTGTMSFCIECDGNYWHATAYQEGDQKYSELSKLQKKNLRNDKLKNNMMHELGIPLLRFSETDIKRNIKYVEERIKLLLSN